MNEREQNVDVIKLSEIASYLYLKWFYSSLAQDLNRTGDAPMLSQGHNRTGDEPMLGGDRKITTIKCSRVVAADLLWNSIHREENFMERTFIAFRYWLEELALEL